MLALRELLVFPFNGKYVIIGGNMRFRAMKDLGMASAPCKVLDPSTPVEKLREYTIKDNNAFGQNDWDILANEWETKELQEWGMDVWGDPIKDEPKMDTSNPPQVYSNITPEQQEQNEEYTTVYSDDTANLPEELQGVNITPEPLQKIVGSDETALDRIIIVYPKDKKDFVAQKLGLEEITKVIYNLNEIFN